MRKLLSGRVVFRLCSLVVVTLALVSAYQAPIGQACGEGCRDEFTCSFIGWPVDYECRFTPCGQPYYCCETVLVTSCGAI